MEAVKMKPKLSEIKKNLEDFVAEGIPEEGFIVNSFRFFIPESIEKFFDTFVDKISIFDIFLDVWLSGRRQAIFVVAYRDYFSSEERNSGLNEYKEDFGNRDPKEFPVVYVGFNIYFERKDLSPAALRTIEEHKHFFKDFSIDESYVSLYWRAKDFDIDFIFARDLI
jgi:hypothetical protein